jgi:GSCFA family
MNRSAKSSCPYFDLPDSSRWDRAMAGRPLLEINPHTSSPLKITPTTRVGSGGSCFAQNITTALRNRGYNYFVTEAAPPFLSNDDAIKNNYGIFSARYGNLYTPLQWLQLIQRSVGSFTLSDQFWSDGKGRFFDLLRPRIKPQGFSSQLEMESDVRQHLRAVKALFEQVDVFVFTLGLTEGWQSTVDGAIYPTCPGCGSAGDFDPTKYVFRNFSVAETTDHLSQAIKLLVSLNPTINVILTVSPVPLIATMEQRHVLQATTYSKSVLRVAAEQTALAFDDVHYFASFEIITGTGNTQSYFADDRRSVTQDGIEHVMKCFFELYGSTSEIFPTSRESIPTIMRAAAVQNAGIICDEEEFFRALAEARAGER